MALKISKEIKIPYENHGITKNDGFISKFPQLNSVIEHVVTAEEAYVMVQRTESSKEKINAQVITYFDDTKELIVDTKRYEFEIDLSEESPNHHTQTYLYLKSLPEFSDAIDC